MRVGLGFTLNTKINITWDPTPYSLVRCGDILAHIQGKEIEAKCSPEKTVLTRVRVTQHNNIKNINMFRGFGMAVCEICKDMNN
jgi:hypothetical protein